MRWKQRIQHKYVHYCTANPRIDRAEQSPAEIKKDLLFSQASLYQMSYTSNNCSPLTSDLPVSRSSVLEIPSLLSTGSRQMTNTNLITPPFCQHSDDGFKFFSAICSNQLVLIKAPTSPHFPTLFIAKSIFASFYSLFLTFPRDPAPTKRAPSHPHAPTYLLVAVSGCVGLPLV